jgi:hypothetical protein
MHQRTGILSHRGKEAPAFGPGLECYFKKKLLLFLALWVAITRTVCIIKV